MTYNDSPINCMETSKYLGVKLHFTLNYKPHITFVENKIARSVIILSKMRYLFPSPTLLLLYYSFPPPPLIWSTFMGKHEPNLSYEASTPSK